MPDQLRLCLDHVPGITARSAPITDETHGFRRLGRVCEEAELGGAIALELAPSAPPWPKVVQSSQKLRMAMMPHSLL